MKKQSRRDFLKSIAATAITAATGFAMSAVHIEEPERTEAERREKQAHLGDPCMFCGTPHDEVAVGACPALLELPPLRAYWPMWGVFENDNRWHSLVETPGMYQVDFGALYSQNGQLSKDRVSEVRKVLEDRSVQAGECMMETYIESFDLSLLCSGRVNEDRIVEAVTISKVQAQSHRLDALHYIYGLASECNVDIHVGKGHCDDRILGTVESVNDDGSVNVRMGDAVSLDFDGDKRIDWESSGINPEDIAPTDQPMEWTSLDLPEQRPYWEERPVTLEKDICSGRWFAIADNGDVLFSDDNGEQWEFQQPPGHFADMVQDGHKIWGITDQTDIYFSNNGITWYLVEAWQDRV